MKLNLWVPVLFLSITSTCSAWAAPAQVLIIRHGEKPATGDDLSPQGYQRAKELVPYFENNSAVTEYGTPVAIYAFAPKKDAPTNVNDEEATSVRGVETVTPLAQALGMTINTDFTKDETQQAVNQILSDSQYDGKMVLICWEHKMIPQLAQQFGATQAPDKWPGSEVYDQVWEINFDSDGKVSSFKTFAEDIPPINAD